MLLYIRVYFTLPKVYIRLLLLIFPKSTNWRTLSLQIFQNDKHIMLSQLHDTKLHDNNIEDL